MSTYLDDAYPVSSERWSAYMSVIERSNALTGQIKAGRSADTLTSAEALTGQWTAELLRVHVHLAQLHNTGECTSYSVPEFVQDALYTH